MEKNLHLLHVLLFWGILGNLTSTTAQNAFWTENFSNQASATEQWKHSGINDNPNGQLWEWTNDPTAGYIPMTIGFLEPFGTLSGATAENGYFLFNSDANGTWNHDVRLTYEGTPINCSGKNNVFLRLKAQYARYSDLSKVMIGISTDGQNFMYQPVLFNIQRDIGVEQVVYADLDLADNAPQVWIQIRWIGIYEYHLKVDDLELLEISDTPKPCNEDPFALICDDFESYNNGNISPQSANWIPHDLVENSLLSAEVSTEFASQGSKSMKCRRQGSGDDQLLQLGNVSSGTYHLKWKMYVPTGKAAYFNIQHDQTQPGVYTDYYAYQLFFIQDKSIIKNIPYPADTIFNAYPQGAWFQMEGRFDLDRNLAQVYLNGTLIDHFYFPHNLGAVNFYCINSSYIFYVDEVEFVYKPTRMPDLCTDALDITPIFSGYEKFSRRTGPIDNSFATASPGEPLPACFEDKVNGSTTAPHLDNTLWFKFVGDGSKYHIETVPCGSQNYVSGPDKKGDTQMAVYSGACGALTQLACSDNLFPNGEIDWRAGLDIQTTKGENYLLQIDGTNIFGAVAKGEYCIEAIKGEAVSCLDIKMGTYEIDDPYICFGENLLNHMVLGNDFVLPTSGIGGMAWVVSEEPMIPGLWPSSDQYLASSAFISAPLLVNLPNNGSNAFALYYVTPIVVGDGLDLTPTHEGGNNVAGVDPSQGCFIIGESKRIALVPQLANLTADYILVPESAPGNNDGAIYLTAYGGFPAMLSDSTEHYFKWNTGATTQDLTGISAGTYTVKISDPSGCRTPINVTINLTSSTDEFEYLKYLTLSPNPTTGLLHLDLGLEQSEPVQVVIRNILGQEVMRLDAPATDSLTKDIDLSTAPNGTYLLTLAIGQEILTRKIMVQR
jgi:hypothetical protein